MTEPTDSRYGGMLLHRLDRAVNVVEIAAAAVGGIMIFIVMWVGVAEIFLRKLFNSPLYGQLDFVEQSMCLYALLPISYCYRKAGHIRMELIVDRISGRVRWIVETLTAIAALALITVLMPGIVHFFQNAYEIGDSTINTQWPTWPAKSVPIIGFSILWVRIVLELWAYLRLVADPAAEQIAVPTHPSIIEETAL